MKETLIDTDEWVLEKYDKGQRLIVSYFRDAHFVDELYIPYNLLDFLLKEKEEEIEALREVIDVLQLKDEDKKE